MGMFLRLPHGFLRRHLSTLERVLVAAAFAFILHQLMAALPVYPQPWGIVIAAAIFLVTLWSPPVAFFLAVTAALYPLYSVSMYLAVLFLAVTMLAQRPLMHNLGAALLVISAPWLVEYHLEWLPVLLGGLWWGKSGGAWMGGLAAVWGQVLYGMTGTNPDWIAMMGTRPAAGEIAARFGPAGSLETLKLLVTPIAPDPTLLLYHLLQIVVWAMVGGLIGGLAESAWALNKRPWRAFAAALGGAALLLAGSLFLAAWLEQYPAGDFNWILPGLFETALYTGLLAVFLEGTRDFVERPLAVGRRSERRSDRRGFEPEDGPRQPSAETGLQGLFERARALVRREPAHQRPSPALQPTAFQSTQPAAAYPAENAQTGTTDYQPLPVPPNLPRRDPQKQRPDDIIKIELD